MAAKHPVPKGMKVSGKGEIITQGTGSGPTVNLELDEGESYPDQEWSRGARTLDNFFDCEI